MSTNVEMRYGDYQFIPVPPITIGKELQKSEDNTLNGNIFSVALNGQLVSMPTGGLAYIIEKQNALRSGVQEEGKLFTLTCNGVALISGYPRIAQAPQFSESNSNWVFTAPYSLAFEFDDFLIYSGDTTGVAGQPYISDLSESWNIEFIDETAYYSLSLPTGGVDTNSYQLRLTHNVSAVGKAHYNEGGLVKPAWQQARDAVLPKLGYNSQFISNSGVFNLSTTGFGAFNHLRTNETDIRGGAFNVSETWLVLNTGLQGVAGRAVEDFTANIKNSLENGGITSVSIEGSIQGLETRDYGTGVGQFNISESKYTAASGYWANIQSKLLGRAQLFTQSFADRSINPQPLNKSIGHSPSRGIITYAYEYDDRPINCVAGALKEDFTINDTNPTDVIAQITILGRSKGPILQAIGTSGVTTREVNIEVLMPPYTGCATNATGVRLIMSASPKSQVDPIVDSFKQELISRNSQVFTTNDTESWNFKTGRYSRQILWTWQNGCS